MPNRSLVALLAVLSLVCAHGRVVRLRADEVLVKPCEPLGGGGRHLVVTVTDPVGGVLPGASVELSAGSWVELEVTDKDGVAALRAPAMPARLHIELPGFLAVELVEFSVGEGCKTTIGVQLPLDPRNMTWLWDGEQGPPSNDEMQLTKPAQAMGLRS